jgi:7-carboxy-7-deazaguanine synthase
LGGVGPGLAYLVMTYSVKEIFYTLQGEGANTGRPAVFCRFTGCNLWSGLERDRQSASCRFCDTDFVGVDGVGGGKFATPVELATKVSGLWPSGQRINMLVVCTGGEPLLQLDEALIDAFHREGFEVAVETNGTCVPPQGIDWLCVSPKGVEPIVVTGGDELKLVYPQEDAFPEMFENLNFKSFFLQPMDGMNAKVNTTKAITYCKEHPKWRLSVQTHKVLGIA